ncbi:DUF4209 domain-containing protein [Duganella vulcania]|uniref:DUF4209 domain-containing protein n=1 Tax=Duganella vulcania TaxID=2692166 RepID=A0A845GDT2_9BURK|nr:DUF4209 domain-containing protein [Duganella vulcania]MYM92783.1 DUF4209 domain-containing protein [Duganella vulcania]
MPKEQEPIESPGADSLTVDDLAGSGYEGVLAAEPDGLQYGWSNAFLARAGAAREAGATRQAKVLGILASITSMRLSPETKTTPFLPGMTWPDGARSPLPGDLAPDVPDWLALVAPGVADVALRTRMADLVWLLGKRHGVSFAQLAIDGYMATSLRSDEWTESGGMCWHRALQLAKGIGKAGADRVALIRQRLLAAFHASARDLAEGMAPRWYVDILFVERCPDVDAMTVAGELADIAQRHTGAGNHWMARDYFDYARLWYGRAQDGDRGMAMLHEVARSWEAQGDAAGPGPLALHLYQNAVKALRDLPGAQRDRLAGFGAVERVRQKLLLAGQHVLGDMSTLQGPGVAVDDFIAYAQQRVQCLRPTDALLAFVTMEQPPSAAAFRQGALAGLDSSIGRLFSSTTLAGDGRVVEQHCGVGDAPTEEQIMSEMVRSFDRQAQIIGGTMIAPALHVMRQRFSLSVADFVFMAEHSPLVPRERVDLVAKGLHAGFHLDFAQATHILLPQFEQMVRVQLKAAGALTSSHEGGVDMEIGLSALAERPQMREVFGEDVTFEIRALMCHQQGANLRNAVAHGLADGALCESAQAVYAWWLILRLVLQALRAMVSADGAATQASGS